MSRESRDLCVDFDARSIECEEVARISTSAANGMLRPDPRRAIQPGAS